ncbi:MAG: hypothetical protein DME26_17015 [Verrucomicrobia bacterium]|nr:MAG: hypothetical protein DME26_17015 [Verrucomicrobiota bacterium]
MKKIIRTSTQYIINGREYSSLEEMPEEDRQFFLDANKNGIPDGIEKLMAGAISPSIQTHKVILQKKDIVVDATSSVEMPPVKEAIDATPEPPYLPNREPQPTNDRWVIQVNLKTIIVVLAAATIGAVVLFLFARR